MGATRQAIADATDFDERDMNHNFDYDYDAYIEVKRNLSRLIDLDQLPSAMELALDLMEEGSRQVEMSDEGLMTDDIEECLMVVIKALGNCDLPTGEVLAWCSAMLDADRVKFICDRELEPDCQRWSVQPLWAGSRRVLHNWARIRHLGSLMQRSEAAFSPQPSARARQKGTSLPPSPSHRPHGTRGEGRCDGDGGRDFGGVLCGET